MKKTPLLLLVIVSLFFTYCGKEKANYVTKQVTDKNGYSYEEVTNDPLGTRIYILENGLTVYLSDNKDEPRIQTYIAVKAGSTFDPAETTGLAHYLEHMLFKGTDEIATTNWEKEEVLLQQISDLFEKHKNTNNVEEKKAIYKKIDSVSTVAASYAIPNEYDKIVSLIGAKQTNAYTSNEKTVYQNEIPSNQLENWLKLEKERFSKLVLRLFHTELETVYEEFNMSQDNDYRKVMYATMTNLFPDHPYGTQTTLGKAEHLKNPSMVNIHNYFNTYYVPNNMAVCLSGDLDFDKTIQLIDKHFGEFKSKEVPKKDIPASASLTETKILEVIGPDAESVNIVYRFDGIKSEDYKYVRIIDQILSNRTAGLIDLDLVQQQKVLSAGSYPYFLNLYGMHNFYATMRDGQTFEEASNLLFQEIDKIKTGDFDDWMLSAAIKDIKLSKIKSREYNNRAHEFVSAFTSSIEWADYLARDNELAKITKEDLMKFASLNYKNYVAVHKKNGKDTVAIKIEKPKITPIKVNREDKSDFFVSIKNNKPENLKPVWLDFEKEIVEKELKQGITFNYMKNKSNDLFYLYYIFDMGKKHDKKLSYAVKYLDYLGTDQYTASEIKKEFYKLGIELYVYTSSERSYVYMSGLDESMEEGIKLFEHLLNNAKPNKEAYSKYIEGVIKKRADNKLNKYSILYGAVFPYSQYGANSSATDIISNNDLLAIEPQELTNIVKGLSNYQHRIFYYGKQSQENVEAIIVAEHKTGDKRLALPEPSKYKTLDFTEDKVYIIDYDMVQTWIVLMTKDEIFNLELAPYSKIFGEYFGSGLSSIVFQEIRESRALAYSAYSVFNLPSMPQYYHFNYCYVATQADKMINASQAMLELLNNMPKSEIQFNATKEAIMQGYQTDRINRTGIFWSYLSNKDKGIDYDLRKDIYEKVDKMTIDEFEVFFNSHISNKKHSMFILGNKELIDIENLKQFGEIEYLTLEEIFNY